MKTSTQVVLVVLFAIALTVVSTVAAWHYSSEEETVAEETAAEEGTVAEEAEEAVEDRVYPAGRGQVFWTPSRVCSCPEEMEDVAEYCFCDSSQEVTWVIFTSGDVVGSSESGDVETFRTYEIPEPPPEDLDELIVVREMRYYHRVDGSTYRIEYDGFDGPFDGSVDRVCSISRTGEEVCE